VARGDHANGKGRWSRDGARLDSTRLGNIVLTFVHVEVRVGTANGREGGRSCDCGQKQGVVVRWTKADGVMEWDIRAGWSGGIMAESGGSQKVPICRFSPSFSALSCSHAPPRSLLPARPPYRNARNFHIRPATRIFSASSTGSSGQLAFRPPRRSALVPPRRAISLHAHSAWSFHVPGPTHRSACVSSFRTFVRPATCNRRPSVRLCGALIWRDMT
jgi:hypothetical protein